MTKIKDHPLVTVGYSATHPELQDPFDSTGDEAKSVQSYKLIFYSSAKQLQPVQRNSLIDDGELLCTWELSHCQKTKMNSTPFFNRLHAFLSRQFSHKDIIQQQTV